MFRHKFPCTCLNLVLGTSIYDVFALRIYTEHLPSGDYGPFALAKSQVLESPLGKTCTLYTILPG